MKNILYISILFDVQISKNGQFNQKFLKELELQNKFKKIGLEITKMIFIYDFAPLVSSYDLKQVLF